MKIHEDAARGIVAIDGIEIEGWIDSETCPHCTTQRVYYDDHDAFFCPTCNTWIEAPCSDDHCRFCVGRPERPLPARSEVAGPTEEDDT
jgi:hypothetical protein